MGEYIGSFGLQRFVGRGEGVDVKYDAAAKPSLGANKVIEVVVNEHGPVPNKGTGYGRDGAYVPAGAVVVGGRLIVDKKGSAANVKLELVKKDGSAGVELLAAVASLTDASTNEFAGAALNTVLAEDRYFKVSGTLTGLEAKAILEYI